MGRVYLLTFLVSGVIVRSRSEWSEILSSVGMPTLAIIVNWWSVIVLITGTKCVLH